MRLKKNALIGAVTLLLSLPASAADLKIVSVDIDGGAATIYLTPEGQSLLVDSGSSPGPANLSQSENDSLRIVAAAKKLGITRFNHVLTTHYHSDHVAGLPALLEKMPADNFIDHGPNREVASDPRANPDMVGGTEKAYAAYIKAIQGHPRRIVKPGDVIKIGSLTLNIVTSDGAVIEKPIAGGGQPNPACAGSTDNEEYVKWGIENPRSVGVLFTYGVTRILSLGDLTWNVERALFCPLNKVGPVDVLIVTQHGITAFMGFTLSNAPFAVAAEDPIVAIMGNGAMKGGGAEIAGLFQKSPHLQGFWPNHQTAMDPKDGPLIDYTANLLGGDDGHSTRADVSDTGVIKVTNERNGVTKSYNARGHK